jgi:hypothetical protein
MLDHRRTGSGRRDDRVCIGRLKDVDKSFGESSCFTPVSAIERRLAAARLPLVKLDLATRTPKHVHGALAHLWKKLVDDAGYKE